MSAAFGTEVLDARDRLRFQGYDLMAHYTAIDLLQADKCP